MKIGILTFHRAHNYGAMLQAYALHRFLTKKGHDVEFISYRQPKIENAYKAWLWSFDSSSSLIGNLKNLISNIFTLRRRIKRRNAFEKFLRNNLPESRKYSKEELFKVGLTYDIVFFGSDQIWTCRFMGAFDDVYWGDIHLKNGRKVAYAPSMEMKAVSKQEELYIKEHIKNFDSISAREISMSNLLSSITGLPIPVVVDPTLLCRKEDYQSLISSSKHVPSEPYILVYHVGHFNQVKDISQKVADQLNCKIIEIGSRVFLHSDSNYKDGYGPEDFVALIANATFVVSCSFHGTAFSVNFHKPFYSILIPGLDARAISFLTQIDLLKCGIRNVDEVDVHSVINIDYANVDIKLEQMRTISMRFIDETLK